MSNKTFISYRRSTSMFLARAIFDNLQKHKIDVFLDVESVDAGEFREVIEQQISGGQCTAPDRADRHARF